MKGRDEGFQPVGLLIRAINGNAYLLFRQSLIQIVAVFAKNPVIFGIRDSRIQCYHQESLRREL